MAHLGWNGAQELKGKFQKVEPRKKRPPWLGQGYIGNYTTQLYSDYNKQL